MKFVVAGAGAVGAYVGALMHRAGLDVTLHARGAHLAAMRENGVTVEGQFTVRPAVVEEVPPADVIFLGVKAHGLPALAPHLPKATVVSMQNGVPWWLTPLERTDPGGVIARSIDARDVVGSIVYFSTEVVAPGVIRHIDGNRITLGEPDGTRSERVRRIAEALVAAGLRAPITTHLREEIWVKLLGNASFNPISALTRKTLVEIIRDPNSRGLVEAIMAEVQAVAHAMGLTLPVTIEQRIAGAEKIGAHKTSMLQDLEAGRPLELEPIVGAVIEIAEKVGVPAPHLRSVYACTKLLARRE